MDGNKLPSSCREVAAFRRYYNDLLRDVERPVILAESLCSNGVISRKVKDSITSRRTDVEKGRAVLDAYLHALVQSSQPSATMQSLRSAFKRVSYFLPRSFTDMEKFVDGELLHDIVN